MTTIHGYTYDHSLPASPVSLDELELLKQTVVWSDQDAVALRMAGSVLEDQIDHRLALVTPIQPRHLVTSSRHNGVVTTRRELDRKFIAAVDRLGRALRIARQEIATRHQVSLLQLQLLEHLSQCGDRRVGALASEFDVTQPTMSDALSALERKELLHRERDPEDGRANTVVLTDKGQDLATRITADLAPITDQRRRTSRGDQAAALQVLLEEVLRLQRNGTITVNRSCLSCTHYQQPRANAAAHCLLLDTPLEQADLRVNCPEYSA